LAGLLKGTPVVRRYLAGSMRIPACPWFPPPSVVGMLARIAISYFSSVVKSWFVGCPWILMTVSFRTSSRMSARTPIVGANVLPL
jgi:hypothetical protein